MNSYSDVDGVPAGADPWLLTEVLRDTWGFEGTVVSDYWAVPFLTSMHGVAADMDGAGVLALQAGIDVELPDTLGFSQQLVERVANGELDEAVVDRAARRVLRQKIEPRPARPGLDPGGARSSRAEQVDLDSPANRALARELAERSIVLLDAGTALPLAGEGRPAPATIAVVGPAADDPRTFMGCYAFPNHVLPRYPSRGLGIEVPSLADGARRRAARRDGSSTRVAARRAATTARASPRPSTAARQADVCVVAVGDLAGPLRPRHVGRGLRRRRPDACPACRASSSPSCSRPARRSSSSWSPGGRMRWARSRDGPPASCRPSCPARRAGQPSPECSRGGSSRPATCRSRSRGTRGRSRAPTSSRDSVWATTASRRSTSRRSTRSDSARPTPSSRSRISS